MRMFPGLMLILASCSVDPEDVAEEVSAGGTAASTAQPPLEVAEVAAAAGVWLTAAYPLVIQNPDGVTRFGDNARGGLSFLEGEVTTQKQLWLTDEWGQEVPFQLHPLGASWPDGSMRRALIQLQTDLAPYEKKELWLWTYSGPIASSPTTNPMSVTCVDATMAPVICDADENGDLDANVFEVSASSGALDLRFRPSDLYLPGEAWRNGTQVISPGDATFHLSAYLEQVPWNAAGLPIVSANGDLARFGFAGQNSPAVWQDTLTSHTADLRQADRVTIEEVGPVRTVLRFERDSGSAFGFVARVFLYANDDAWRTEFTLISQGDVTWSSGIFVPDARHVDHFQWQLKPTGTSFTSAAYGKSTVPSRFATHQVDGASNSGWSTEATSWPVAGTPIDSGWLALQSGSAPIAVATKHFGEKWPKRIIADPVGLRMEFQPAAGPLGAEPWTQLAVMPVGRARTYSWITDLMAPSGPEASARARHELLIQQSPEHASAREQSHPFATETQFPLLPDYRMSRTLLENGSYLGRTFGERDFGDVHGPSENGGYFQNHQYAPAATSFDFFRGLNPEKPDPGVMPPNLEAFYTGEAEVWHAMDVDSINWTPDRTLLGFEPGTRAQRGGRRQDHIVHEAQGYNHYQYTSDLAKYYYLTGDRRPIDLFHKMFASARFDLPAGFLSGMVHDRGAYVPVEGTITALEAVGTIKAWNPSAIENPDRMDHLDLTNARSEQVVLVTRKTLDDLALNAPGALPPVSFNPAFLPSNLFDAYDPSVQPEDQWHTLPPACGNPGVFRCYKAQEETRTCDLWTPIECTPSMGFRGSPYRIEALGRGLFLFGHLSGETAYTNRLFELATYLSALHLPAGGPSYEPMDAILRYYVWDDSSLNVTAAASLAWTAPYPPPWIEDGVSAADYRLSFFRTQATRNGVINGADRDLMPFLAAYQKHYPTTPLSSPMWWNDADLNEQTAMILGLGGYPASTTQATGHRAQALCSMVWNVAHGKARLYGNAASAAWVNSIVPTLPGGSTVLSACMAPEPGTGIYP